MLNLLDSFTCLGLDLVESVGGQYKGTCPFCDKAGHFFVKSGEVADKGGHWHCKSCDERGNIYTFLTRLIDTSLELTTSDDYHELWDLKRISPAAAKLFRICKSSVTDQWLIPSCSKNQQGEIRTLTIHRWEENSNQLRATTNIANQVIGRHLLNEEKPESLIFGEGHWDGVVMTHLLYQAKLNTYYDNLATPGAHTLKEEWLKFFEGYEEIFLIYDGDHPRTTKSGNVVQAGLDGMRKAYRMLRDHGIKSKIWCIDWPEGLKSGYDVRDLFIDTLKNLRKRK